MPNVSLAGFWDVLSSHDWTYMMSDDPSVYRVGQTKQNNIDGMRTMSPAHEKLYQEFHSHAWKHTPKPERPQ